MPKFPDFDQAGIGYDLHVWHPEWGSTHISVGIPSYPADVFDVEALDGVLRQLATDLLPTGGFEKVLEVTRFQTESTTWHAPEPPTP
ncbi:hypothetical protein ACIPQA_16530 [Streptomyces sp. NPDC090109]|uniref:hypothetical protein n=1 Tax=Streptomyces sp. NPDC090109 TaxID=3365948 RepID=UPI0037FBF8A3